MSKNIKKIDVCIGNLDKGTDWVIEQVKSEFPHVNGQRWGCLGNCANCYRRPFVLANDRYVIETETKEELLAQLRADMSPPPDAQS
ncbi:MAG TPA: DUF1450 domain-containing protein [Bacilli bacterium]|nr:DUF1450 domain-containing protein [Bacilli bacterium]